MNPPDDANPDRDGLAMPSVWQVCFVEATEARWWNSWLKPGFRHVFLLGYVPEHRVWIYFDTQYESTALAIVDGGMAGRLLTYADQSGRILTWHVRDADRPRVWHHFGSWCVPAVRHVLGLWCVAMTPKGLHDFMLKQGARPFPNELQREGSEGRSGDRIGEGAAAEAG